MTVTLTSSSWQDCGKSDWHSMDAIDRVELTVNNLSIVPYIRDFIWDIERCLWTWMGFILCWINSPCALSCCTVLERGLGDEHSKMLKEFNVLQHWDTGTVSCVAIELRVTRWLNRQGLYSIDPYSLSVRQPLTNFLIHWSSLFINFCHFYHLFIGFRMVLSIMLMHVYTILIQKNVGNTAKNKMK